MKIQFTMPILPPSVNCCYRSVGKRVYKSSRLRTYEGEMKSFLATMFPDNVMLEGKIKLTVEFYIKGQREIDIDNMLKALIDNLEGKLFENDKHIVEIHAKKTNNCDESKTVVLIEQDTEIQNFSY